MSRLSIRLVLGQVIGFLGIFLVVLCAMGLYRAAERHATARRVVSLASTSQQLFSTLMGEDVEARRSFIQRNAKDVRFLDI